MCVDETCAPAIARLSSNSADMKGHRDRDADDLNCSISACIGRLCAILRQAALAPFRVLLLCVALLAWPVSGVVAAVVRDVALHGLLFDASHGRLARYYLAPHLSGVGLPSVRGRDASDAHAPSSVRLHCARLVGTRKSACAEDRCVVVERGNAGTEVVPVVLVDDAYPVFVFRTNRRNTDHRGRCLFCHGNAENVATLAPAIQAFADATGYDVFAPDYGGFWESASSGSWVARTAASARRWFRLSGYTSIVAQRRASKAAWWVLLRARIEPRNASTAGGVDDVTEFVGTDTEPRQSTTYPFRTDDGQFKISSSDDEDEGDDGDAAATGTDDSGAALQALAAPSGGADGDGTARGTYSGARIVYGSSLGATAALFVAAYGGDGDDAVPLHGSAPTGLVLDAAFSSIGDVVLDACGPPRYAYAAQDNIYALGPSISVPQETLQSVHGAYAVRDAVRWTGRLVRWATGLDVWLNNVATAMSVTCPVFLVHGTCDETVSVDGSIVLCHALAIGGRAMRFGLLLCRDRLHGRIHRRGGIGGDDAAAWRAPFIAGVLFASNDAREPVL
jgi:hypothetical protein